MPKDSPGNTHPLDYMFHPQSIAVVGISADLPKFWMRQLYFDGLLRSGYPGRIYLVNPKGGELEGYPIYRTLTEVPGPVDHVVVSIPARFTPALMEECRAKGVKVVHVFASGFAETGEPDRTKLQNQLVDIARRGNMRIIGPNCLGIYYPKGKIGLSPDFPRDPGPIGYLCQSGGNTDFMVRLADTRGLRFSKVVSYGNACDVNECDLIDYFAADPETEVIAAYIEGVADGQRFSQVLKKAASVKPVVVYKGGYTEGGLRAAASHTGSLAGADAVWEGVLRQAGAIRVYSIEEMVDMLVALLRMEPPQGPNTCVVGTGGGASVMATDEIERAGLRMAPMPPEIRERLKEFIDLANSMLRNPIDAGPISSHDGFDFLVNSGSIKPMEALRNQATREVGGHWKRFHDVLRDWRDLDLLVFHHGFDISPVPVDEYAVVGAAGLMMLASRQFDLPKAIVLHSISNDSTWQVSAELRALCVELGLPLFLSMRGAATAIRRLTDFHRAHPGWRPRQDTAADVTGRTRGQPGEVVRLDTAALLGIPPSASCETAQPEPADGGLKEREKRFRAMIENSLVRDITERKTAEREHVEHAAALARAEELEESRQRIVAAQESVRRDIAHQLHGSVQNQLIIVLHRLAEIERTTEPGELSQELGDLRQKLTDLLDNHVRPISHHLYPLTLRRGLIAALQSLADHFEQSLPIDLKLDDGLVKGEKADNHLIPEQVSLAAYRIAEEAMTNIVKHAMASSVTIALDRSPEDWLRLELRDDGQGFDMAAAAAGRGLMMMRDYAAVAGGSCTVESVPGKGTEITALLPLSAPRAEHPETACPSG